MRNLLVTGRNLLIEKAIDLYNDRRLELTLAEYPDHYAELGRIICRIDLVQDFPELVAKVANGEFEELGLFSDDRDMMESFLRELLKSMMY